MDVSCRLLTNGGHFVDGQTSVAFLYQATFFISSQIEPRTGYLEALFAPNSHVMQLRHGAEDWAESDAVTEALLKAVRETEKRLEWVPNQRQAQQREVTERATSKRGGASGRKRGGRKRGA